MAELKAPVYSRKGLEGWQHHMIKFLLSWGNLFFFNSFEDLVSNY
jgi:hypothetical protein